MAAIDAPATALLSVSNIEVAYGRSAPALRGVSLRLREGEVVSLLGANGAGKTTLIRSISGLLKLHSAKVLSGQVNLDGARIDGVAAHHIARKGLSQVPEGRMIFANLTVAEHLQIGALSAPVEKHEMSRRLVLDLFPALRPRIDDQAGWLSGGEQQMVAIGRALMASPRLMLLDEVSLGLAPIITRSIFEQLDRYRRETGCAMLVVEQNAKLALDFCDRAYVLDRGRILLEGSAADLKADPRVQDLYLGEAPGEGSAYTFRDAKRYRRRTRWLK
ncbi:MAG: ABC transporter ATP-binding protein [Rhizobiaceae bacterium]|nr:ABC transporter ATP-binding protein [Rhizobiaceae bacterium]